MDEQQTITAQHSRATEIITSGHVWSAVWYLAWPTIINTLVQTAYMVINAAFLGHLRLGAGSALAAVGIGATVLNIQFSLMMGLSIGTSALVSRFLGARQMDDAEQAARQSLFLGTLIGFLSAIPLVALAAPIVALVGAKGAVAPAAADYMKLVAYSSVPAFLYMIVTAALRSAGDMKSPLYAGATLLAVNIVFDYLLIFGFGPVRVPMLGWEIPAVHALGVRGAAIATNISRVTGLVVILWFFNRSVLGGALRRMVVHAQWFARIMNIGWPAMLQSLLWTMAGLAMVTLLGRFQNATAAVAALTLGLRIEALAYMPGVAYASAATPLVGQNLGAGKPDRAEHSAWVAAGQAVAIMTVIASSFIIVPRQLTHAFTNDPLIVPLVVLYIQINAISEPFLALGMVLRGALQGAGDVRVPTLITFITFYVVRLPLVWLLGTFLGMGAKGAWIAISGSTILSGILTMIWFKTGHWRAVKV